MCNRCMRNDSDLVFSPKHVAQVEDLYAEIPWMVLDRYPARLPHVAVTWGV